MGARLEPGTSGLPDVLTSLTSIQNLFIILYGFYNSLTEMVGDFSLVRTLQHLQHEMASSEIDPSNNHIHQIVFKQEHALIVMIVVLCPCYILSDISMHGRWVYPFSQCYTTLPTYTQDVEY